MRKIPPYLLLDAWRGLAALWVVMLHSCLPFLATGENVQRLHAPLYAVSIRGALGVVLFFVISGYCIMGAAYGALASGRSAASYGFDRLRRIYPPYLGSFVLFIAMTILLSLLQSHHLLRAFHHNPDWAAWSRPEFWVANVLLLQVEMSQPSPNFVAWTLCYEIVFYAIIGALLLAAKAVHRGDRSAALPVFRAGIGALTLVSLAWLIAAPASCPFPLDRWYQFGLGALLYLAVAGEDSSATWQARVLLLISLALTVVFAVRYDLTAGAEGLAPDFILGRPSTRSQAVTALLFTVVLWILQPHDGRFSRLRALRPLLWLGTISYSLYLIHLLVINFPDAGGRRLGFDGDWYWITYLMEIATAIVAGWLYHLAVERHFISSRQKRRVAEELRG